VSIEATDRGAVMRRSRVARTIRAARLVVVLRQIAPRTRLLDLVGELADAGARVFEITLDGADAPEDIAATREHLAPRPGEPRLVGAGTIRTRDELRAAIDAGASFGASPVFDPGDPQSGA